MGIPAQDHFLQAGANRRKADVSPEVQAAIDSTIAFMAPQGGSCCPLTLEQQEGVKHDLSKKKDAGKGDLFAGINERDDDAGYWHNIREINNKVFNIALYVVVTAVVGYLIYLKAEGR